MISALFKHGYQSRARADDYWADTSPYVVDSSRIKWAWFRWLGVHDHSFVLKHSIKLFSRLFIDLVNQPFELRFQGQIHMGAYSSIH